MIVEGRWDGLACRKRLYGSTVAAVRELCVWDIVSAYVDSGSRARFGLPPAKTGDVPPCPKRQPRVSALPAAQGVTGIIRA